MSFKLVFLVTAVFAVQANSQGLIRPMIAEFAKPFVQFGQQFIRPAADYFQIRPQWSIYPDAPRPKPPMPGYEGYDGMQTMQPGNFIQYVGPRPFRPIFFPASNKPFGYQPDRPRPIPVPAPSSSSEESGEMLPPPSVIYEPAPQVKPPRVPVPHVKPPRVPVPPPQVPVAPEAIVPAPEVEELGPAVILPEPEQVEEPAPEVAVPAPEDVSAQEQAEA